MNKTNSYLSKYKLNQKVVDRWFSFYPKRPWGIGTIVKKTKSTLKVKFNSEIITYDKIHIEEFLLPYSKKMKNIKNGLIPINFKG